MHAHIAGHAFELLGQRQQGLDVLFLGQAFGQHRLGLDRTIDGDVLCPGLFGISLLMPSQKV
jgi:hypothetical protein